MAKRKPSPYLLQPLARIAAAQVQLEKAAGFVRVAQSAEETRQHDVLLRFAETQLDKIAGELGLVGATLTAIVNQIEARPK